MHQLTTDSLLSFATLVLYGAFLTVSLVEGGNYRHLGCWADTDVDDHDIKDSVAQMGSGVTVDKCASFCAGRGLPYAGIQSNGACYCGLTYGSHGRSFDCNTTCGLFSCGGYQANDVYYTADADLTSQRVMKVATNGKSYNEARSSCVLAGGDLVTPHTTTRISTISNAVNSSTSGKNVWVGLRRRLPSGPYEWTDENVQPSYDSRSSDYASSWIASDPELDCVSIKADSQKLQSMDCDTELPFTCMQLPGSPAGEEVTEETVTDPPESISAESKRLALFVVLPLFLCCYGGSCIIYCVHKIIRNCARARLVNEPPAPQLTKPPTAVPVVVGQPAVALGAREKRPMSGSKVAPAPQPPILAYMNAPKAPEPGPVTEMKPLGPPSAKDREEARRARLLENAAREARERKQTSRPNTAASSSQPPADDTAKLLDEESPRAEGAETPHGLAGMSINDILKMKAKDGPRKPRKIVSS